MRNKTTTILSIIIFSIITSCSEERVEAISDYGVNNNTYKESLSEYKEDIARAEKVASYDAAPKFKKDREERLRLTKLEFHYFKELSKKMPLKEAIKEAYKLASLDILKNPS
jgi:hypothetical protein